MSDLEERIVKVSIQAGSVHAKREAVANEVKAVSALVEEMFCIAKQSYSAATASHMEHIAFEHNVTNYLATAIENLRPRRQNRFMDLAMLARYLSCHDSR
jgi:hypothetical protein